MNWSLPNFLLFSIQMIMLGYSLPVSGQLKLDVNGNAKIRGRLELSYPVDITSLAIGEGAGAFEDETEFRSNTFVGYNAGHFNTTGKYNTANGANALYYNQNGSHQTALGYLALYWTGFNGNTSGYNTAVGALALTNTTTGIENSALGYQAGYSNTTGRWNTFIGSRAGRYFSSGDNNVFIGHVCRSFGNSGNNNVIIGDSAALVNNGSNNVVIGYRAARNLLGISNIIIGNEAAAEITAANNMLWIENSSSSTPLIYGDFVNDRVGINCTNPQAGLSVDGDIKAIGIIEAGQATTCMSDRRLKKDITELRGTIPNIPILRPVRYQWRKEDFPEMDLPEKEEIGFIAQEIEELYPGLEFTGEDSYKALDYSRLTVILTKAIQELSEQNNQLKKRYRSIGERIALLESSGKNDSSINSIGNEK